MGLRRSAKNGNLKAMVACIAPVGGQAVDEQDDYGWTALHYAAGHNRYEAAALLLSRYGADKNKLDKRGRTPADLAFRNGHTQLAAFIRSFRLGNEKYILYLHPKNGIQNVISDFANDVNQLRKSGKISNQNSALGYPMHATLTGFFHMDSGYVGEMIDHLKRSFNGSAGLFQRQKVVDTVRGYTGPSYGLNLVCPSLDRWLKENLWDRNEYLDCLSKKGMHISFAYGQTSQDSVHYKAIYEKYRSSLESPVLLDQTEWVVNLWKCHNSQWSRLFSWDLKAGRELRNEVPAYPSMKDIDSMPAVSIGSLLRGSALTQCGFFNPGCLIDNRAENSNKKTF